MLDGQGTINGLCALIYVMGGRRLEGPKMGGFIRFSAASLHRSFALNRC